jgi:hypothetical protein
MELMSSVTGMLKQPQSVSGGMKYTEKILSQPPTTSIAYGNTEYSALSGATASGAVGSPVGAFILGCINCSWHRIQCRSE